MAGRREEVLEEAGERFFSDMEEVLMAMNDVMLAASKLEECLEPKEGPDHETKEDCPSVGSEKNDVTVTDDAKVGSAAEGGMLDPGVLENRSGFSGGSGGSAACFSENKGEADSCGLLL